MDVDTPPSSTPKRKRRSKKNRTRITSLADPKLGAKLAVAMTALGLLYVGVKFYDYFQSVTGYGPAGLGSRAQQVVYVYGPPTAVRNPGERTWRQAADPSRFLEWRFDQGPILLHATFSPDGRLNSISCMSTGQPGLQSCPSTLGINLGDDELHLLDILGSPADETLSGGWKISKYPATGYDFGLEHMQIRSIRYYRTHASHAARLMRFLRWIVP